MPRRRASISLTIAATSALTLILILCAASCSGDDEDSLCEGPEILPHLSPVALGELYPLGNNEEDTRQRIARALQLARGQEP